MSIVHLDKETAIKKISSKCSEALQQALKGNVIHFASDVVLDFGLVRPEKMNYEEDNQYELLHSLIEKCGGWNKFPKRDQSIIASTLKVPADRKHNVYVVLPVNGARIAVCSEDDFYTSFDHIEKQFKVKEAKEFEDQLRILCEAVNHFVHEKSMESFSNSELVTTCKTFDNIMKAFKGSYEFKTFYRTTTKQDFSRWENNNPLYEKIIEAMDPELNGFEMITLKEIGNFKKRELWFANECYIISKQLFSEIIDSGKLAHIIEDVK